MLKIRISIKKNKKEAKDLIIKGVFNAANHRKIIKKAAEASFFEQQKIIDKYNKIISD